MMTCFLMVRGGWHGVVRLQRFSLQLLLDTKSCLLFEAEDFVLNSLIDFKRFFDYTSKFKHFIDCLSITLFLLFDDLQRAMLFAEDSVRTFSIHSFNFHEIICTTSTLDME